MRVLTGENDHLDDGRLRWRGTYLGDRDICGRGLLERAGSRAFVKVYESQFEGLNRRERPLGSWKGTVEGYILGRQRY